MRLHFIKRLLIASYIYIYLFSVPVTCIFFQVGFVIYFLFGNHIPDSNICIKIIFSELKRVDILLNFKIKKIHPLKKHCVISNIIQ
jgi:hypothetical protein